MRLLFLGDVVGRPGRRAVAAVLPRLRREAEIDFVIANGENASSGKGINPRARRGAARCRRRRPHVGQPHLAESRHRARTCARTSGCCGPLNFAPDVPGVGLDGPSGARRTARRSASINLIGRDVHAAGGLPVPGGRGGAARRAPGGARRSSSTCTARRRRRRWAWGGSSTARCRRSSAATRTCRRRTRRILPGGTAYLTDAGMCGPEHSVLGVRTDQVLRSLLDARCRCASTSPAGPVLVQGALIDVDDDDRPGDRHPRAFASG